MVVECVVCSLVSGLGEICLAAPLAFPLSSTVVATQQQSATLLSPPPSTNILLSISTSPYISQPLYLSIPTLLPSLTLFSFPFLESSPYPLSYPSPHLSHSHLQYLMCSVFYSTSILPLLVFCIFPSFTRAPRSSLWTSFPFLFHQSLCLSRSLSPSLSPSLFLTVFHRSVLYL